MGTIRRNLETLPLSIMLSPKASRMFELPSVVGTTEVSEFCAQIPDRMGQ